MIQVGFKYKGVDCCVFVHPDAIERSSPETVAHSLVHEVLACVKEVDRGNHHETIQA